MSMIEEAENEMMGQPVMLIFDRSTAPKNKTLFVGTNWNYKMLDKYARLGDIGMSVSLQGTLRALSREDFQEICLGNGLADEFPDPSVPDLGMRLVRYISKTGWPPSKRKPIFRVYTPNLFAAYWMVKTLQELGLIAVYEPMEDTEQQ